MVSRALFVGILLAICSVGFCRAEEDAEKKRDNIFPLGALGGTAANTIKNSYLEIRTLIDSAPGQYAGLRVGDRIVGVNGQPFGIAEENTENFGKGPLEMLGIALDAAEGGSGKIKLQVLRDKKSMDIEAVVPKIGAYGAKYPFDCAKSKAFYDELCKRIASSQGRDGGWGGGDVTSAYSAMALLARRDGKYIANVKRWAHHLAEKHTTRESFPKGGCSNWGIAFDGIFLGEYYWATKDEKVLPTMKVIVEELASRQRPEGLYGHSEQPVYGGNGLAIVGSAVLWCFAMSDKCGVPKPQPQFDKLVAYLRTAGEKRNGSNKPGNKNAAPGDYDYGSSGKKDTSEYFIGYSHACRDIGQSIARTSNTVLGLIISGTDRPWAEQLGRHLTSHTYLTLECHAIAAMGMANTCPAQLLSNPEGYRRHMDAWKWYFTLARNPDGSSAYIGSRGNIGGDGYLNFENIMAATVALSLAAPEQNLYMHGKFLDIPGLATGTLSRGMQTAYNEILAKNVTSGLITQLVSTASKVENTDAKPAAQMVEYITSGILQPEISAAKESFDKGDCYDAQRRLAKLKEKYGAHAESVPSAANLKEKLKTPESLAQITLGQTYYKLAEDLDRALKPGNKLYGGLSSLPRSTAALKEFAEKNAKNVYGKLAEQKLRLVETKS